MSSKELEEAARRKKKAEEEALRVIAPSLSRLHDEFHGLSEKERQSKYKDCFVKYCEKNI
jgi:hypothetical protein